MRRQPPALGASAGRGPGSRAPSRKASRPSGFDPRAIMSRSPEALAFGARRHFIPASLSLPLCGCLLDRSRDCSRSRVPPRYPRRRYADAPAAASFSYLRFAPARSHLSPVGERNWRQIRVTASSWNRTLRLGPVWVGSGAFRKVRPIWFTNSPYIAKWAVYNT